MRITTDVLTSPVSTRTALKVFEIFDSLNDSYLAALENYPSPSYQLVTAWSGQNPAAAAVLVGKVITGYVGNDEVRESTTEKGMREVLAHLKGTNESLIIHDVDDPSYLEEAGFIRIDPPSGIKKPVTVFAWNMTADEVYATLNALHMHWDLNMHRYKGKKAQF